MKMLKKFEVKGFKQFSDLSWDFSNIRDYSFNNECISDGLVKNAVVYGKNAAGKTNLGLALFDIVASLTDKTNGDDMYDYYLNALSTNKEAEFYYQFQFGTHSVEYSYSKTEQRIITSEKLSIDNQLMLCWDASGIKVNSDFKNRYRFGEIELNWMGTRLSAVKYVLNNMVPIKGSIMENLGRFVNGMLWFQRNDTMNRYIGLSMGNENLFRSIAEHGYTAEFEKFLNEYGIPVKLVTIKNPDGKSEIYFDFKRRIPIGQCASSGTRALSLFFYWMKHRKDITFLFIDEFDAFYHYELSEKILHFLIYDFHKQAIVTTHNPKLLTNRIVRPDCCFQLEDGKIKSFADSTERELRQGNNLEKLYVSGEFNG